MTGLGGKSPFDANVEPEQYPYRDPEDLGGRDAACLNRGERKGSL